jgi:4-amino-4-deoxy-L-arabinose transferase-like glycosyltransferase
VTSVIAAPKPLIESRAFDWRRVGAVAAALTAVLLVAAPGYGYHRDELYFRLLGRHLSWGYVDQPPLTPAIARVATAVFGDNIVALRVPAALGAAATVLLTALLARELGGSATAQLRAAAGSATAALLLVSGHVFLTASVDIPLTAAVVLLAAKALLRDPRWWLAAGAVAGVALYNKLLIVLLGLAFAVALLVDAHGGRPSALGNRWLWLGALTALVIGLPNLIYQVVNDWPQIDMARAINRTDGSDNRAFFVQLQLVIVGPFLIPTMVRGFRELLRRAAWRPVRVLAATYPIGCIITVVTGGQAYYVFNLLLCFYAAGCVAATGRRVGRSWIPIALNGVASAVIALPIIRLSALGDTPIPAINPGTRDQIGWTRMAEDVAAAYQTIPAGERAHVVVFAENYGEAGAVDRYGPEHGMAGVGVYSGLNALWDLGPPPDDAAPVVLVGIGQYDMSGFFTGCRIQTIFDNGVGVDNEEQGQPIAVCSGPAEPWSVLWPQLRHLG